MVNRTSNIDSRLSELCELFGLSKCLDCGAGQRVQIIEVGLYQVFKGKLPAIQGIMLMLCTLVNNI